METNRSNDPLLDEGGKHWHSEDRVMENGVCVSVRTVDFGWIGREKVGLKLTIGVCELGVDFTIQEAHALAEMLEEALVRLDAVKHARESRVAEVAVQQ